jgi:hypothetical protein
LGRFELESFAIYWVKCRGMRVLDRRGRSAATSG